MGDTGKMSYFNERGEPKRAIITQHYPLNSSYRLSHIDNHFIEKKRYIYFKNLEIESREMKLTQYKYNNRANYLNARIRTLQGAKNYTRYN